MNSQKQRNHDQIRLLNQLHFDLDQLLQAVGRTKNHF